MNKAIVIEAIVSSAIFAMVVTTAYMFAPSTPTGDDVKLAQNRLVATKAKQQRHDALPNLPSLPGTWALINAMMGHCQVSVDTNVTVPPDEVKAGDPPNWVATVKGDAAYGIDCVETAVRLFPVELRAFTLKEGRFSATYQVFGTNPPIEVAKTS